MDIELASRMHRLPQISTLLVCAFLSCLRLIYAVWRSRVEDELTRDSLTQYRTTWTITWTCATTMIACVWLGVHPDMTTINQKWWQFTTWKIGLASLVIVTPELTVTWAFLQWHAARKLLEGE